MVFSFIVCTRRTCAASEDSDWFGWLSFAHLCGECHLKLDTYFATRYVFCIRRLICCTMYSKWIITAVFGFVPFFTVFHTTLRSFVFEYGEFRNFGVYFGNYRLLLPYNLLTYPYILFLVRHLSIAHCPFAVFISSGFWLFFANTIINFRVQFNDFSSSLCD